MAEAVMTTSRNEGSDEHIDVVSRPNCLMCTSGGRLLYEGLKDRPFDTPGLWNLKRCSNPDCGLLWLDPMPSPKDVWKAYRTYYTHASSSGDPLKQDVVRWIFRRTIMVLRKAYLNRNYGYYLDERAYGILLGWLAYLLPWRRSEWDMSVMFLPRIQGGRLLEVGSGAGHLLQELRGLGWDVEGVDVDRAAVENARTKGLKVSVGPLETLHFADNHFDAICMSHVIEHLHDPVRLLAECHRILKPGGKLSLITPNAQSLCHRAFGSSWFALEPPRHLHIFTRRTMQKMLRDAGFVDASVFTTIRDADALFVASRSIRRSGKFKMHSRQPYSEKIAGRFTQVIEWSLLKVAPTMGEELTVIARKQSGGDN
jgi:SAM-dependent methyltransferase